MGRQGAAPNEHRREPVNAYYLDYDIPKCSGVRNPSGLLRRLGFRKSGSVWVVTGDCVPWHLIDKLESAGCEVGLVKFDADEAGKILSMAVKALRKDVESACKSAVRSANRAGADADERVRFSEEYATDSVADGANKVKALTNDLEGVGTGYASATRRILKTAERKLADFEQAARSFGLSAGDISLGSAREAVEAIRNSTAVKARSYVEMAARVRDEQARRAAQSGELPAGVLMDALEDEGQDVSASRLVFVERGV